jgi:hypothetical protein
MNSEYGTIGGMGIDRGYQSTQRKPAPVPFFPPQIPHDLTRDRTWAAELSGGRGGCCSISGSSCNCSCNSFSCRRVVMVVVVVVLVG